MLYRAAVKGRIRGDNIVRSEGSKKELQGLWGRKRKED